MSLTNGAKKPVYVLGAGGKFNHGFGDAHRPATLLMNTSFNLKGEPVVNSPRDIVRTFYRSKLDADGNRLLSHRKTA